MATLNGHLPAEQLVVIPWDGRDRVRTYALVSLSRLNDAFRARFGHDLVVNEGYRDYATQQRYYANPPSGAGTAAVPGTSNHGWGLAVDLKLTSAEYAWMLANAPRFGWINPLWARDGRGVEEPWHWEHVGAPAVVPDPVKPIFKEDDMSNGVLLVAEGRGHTYVVPAVHVHQVVPTEELELIKALGEDVVPIRPLSARQYDVAMAIFFQDTRPPQDRPNVHAVVSSVVEAIKALPAAAGGLSAEQITAAVRAGINGARITAG